MVKMRPHPGNPPEQPDYLGRDHRHTPNPLRSCPAGRSTGPPDKRDAARRQDAPAGHRRSDHRARSRADAGMSGNRVASPAPGASRRPRAQPPPGRPPPTQPTAQAVPAAVPPAGPQPRRPGHPCQPGAPVRRACSAPPTSRARSRCGRSRSATSTTRRSGSSASTRRPRSARRCWSPRWRWLIPVVVTAVLTCRSTCRLDPGSDGFTGDEAAGLIGADRLAGCSAPCCSRLGLILVTGMVAHVTMAAAAIGKKLTLGEAWARDRAASGCELVGLALLLGLMLGAAARAVRRWSGSPAVMALDAGASIALFLLVSSRLFLAAMWWFWIRVYYLPVPALMLEPVGVLRRDRARPRADEPGVLADLRHRPADRDHHRDRRLDPGAPVRSLVSWARCSAAASTATPRSSSPWSTRCPRWSGGVRGAVHRGGHLAAVRRPAHPQGGVRRRADDAGGDHRAQ